MPSAEDRLQAASSRLSLMRAFGERLRRLRDEAGLSEDQLAERSRLNPSIITKAEAGQTDPRLSQIESFARRLGRTAHCAHRRSGAQRRAARSPGRGHRSAMKATSGPVDRLEGGVWLLSELAVPH